ncbi:hypothetical protein [Planosporangium mesophilum]|uniref:Uncharacterized protein n=1 Tax=Planosporangium mesophilum TaxID=689768 RepID=A0A8J3TDQ5_9ACTN|nr:hypothetical protein [Planosporangium mesophilum]NJC85581.1 hypothetical protein [Planosporangium mesophilum]GII24553.1 hypothetical protein Pme01_41500 [Planosporangium mesophilum]
MSGDHDGWVGDGEPTRRAINPDPYPSGIYSALSYPSVSDSARTTDVVARIGDVEVTADTLRTPVGAVPLADATVEVSREQVVRTPTWAVLCAIVGFFVIPLVNLLFLLVKETAEVGPTLVRVTGVGVGHETVVSDPAEIELARSLAES